ncbi:hypothetical protein [Maribacter sp. 4G9]|uniref:hypothetical protein n=1 Tax=Maribacter sp. 4G9 TaxID=1889777 RepID=UPI000C149AC1|nr:hypothetical protein [Maribacter sp. 4G9]PIB37860.1 hypothetical protein BFP75_18915 [Maribacter sp. 4G9]
MKLVLVGFLSFFLFFIHIEEVRKLYPEAIEDTSKTDNLNELLATITLENNAVLYCYKGAVFTLKAKHAKTVKDKKEFFQEGVAIIEAAVASNPENIELRFIRLSVQENAPKIVKYRDAMEADKNFILQHFSELKGGSLKNMIQKYIKDSKAFSDTEKLGF